MIVKALIKNIDLLDEFEGIVQLEINGNMYKAFYFGEDFTPGQVVTVEFGHLDLDDEFDWDATFNQNEYKECKLIPRDNNEWSYTGYGKIIAINPVVADFGDIKLDLGDWTNDLKVIGQYISWEIQRLEICTA